VNLRIIERPFNRSGLAALSDLETPEWKELFEYLEKEQNLFLKNEDQFRSPEYIWPRDPLHTWSRVWEYPYTYYHLKKKRKKLEGNLPRVVDLGSGVTFFPFSVAKLGYGVTCVDTDPICQKDLLKAVELIDCKPGVVDFKISDGKFLSFKDEEVDIVYCISVLEHIPHLDKTIQEIARILKTGGLFLLTIDLDLRGDSEIGVKSYKKLNNTLQNYFNYLYPETMIHPADMLHSESGPYGYKKLKGLSLVWFVIKQNIIKPILGKRPRIFNTPFHLTVKGFVLRKK